MAIINVSDEMVLGFFSAVLIGLVGAVGILWKQMLVCIEDRKQLWKAVQGKQK